MTAFAPPEAVPLKPSSSGSPLLTAFFDRRSFSIQYVVACARTRRCAIIDPVLDFDETSGATATVNAYAILSYVQAQNLTVSWILDTHPHADHFSAAAYLKDRTGAPTGIGEKIVEVQALWKKIYNLPGFPADGSQWDRLFADEDSFYLGDHSVSVLLTPGHTLASVAYVVEGAPVTAFIHDTLFMPDFGTARCDFPGGDPGALWKSIQRILALGNDARLLTGHDYLPKGRAPAWESTVLDQKTRNPHLLRGEHS